MPSPKRLRAGLAAFLLFWTTSVPIPGEAGLSVLAADDLPVVAVPGLRLSGSKTEKRFREYLAEELKASDRLKLVPDGVVAKQVEEVWEQPDAEISTLLESAFQKYTAGKELYEQLEIDAAIKKLNEAVQGYRAGMAALRDNRIFLASHLFLGMALVVRGNVAEGREYIRQMIVLNPLRDTHKLPPKLYPPKIVSLHQELTQKVLKAPTGSILIRTRPSGAQVFLDGVAQPSTPVEIRSVPIGEHFVMAEKKGYGRFAQRVVVTPGENVVESELSEWQPLTPYVFSRRGDAKGLNILNELGGLTGANVMVLGKLTEALDGKDLATGQLYDIRSQEFSRIETVDLGAEGVKKGAKGLAKKLLENLTVTGRVLAQLQPGADPTGIPSVSVGRESPLQRSTRLESPPFYRRWWFWAIVGGVVAGATTAGIMVTQKDANYNVLNIPNPLPP